MSLHHQLNALLRKHSRWQDALSTLLLHLDEDALRARPIQLEEGAQGPSYPTGEHAELIVMHLCETVGIGPEQPSHEIRRQLAGLLIQGEEAIGRVESFRWQMGVLVRRSLQQSGVIFDEAGKPEARVPDSILLEALREMIPASSQMSDSWDAVARLRAEASLMASRIRMAEERAQAEQHSDPSEQEHGQEQGDPPPPANKDD